MRNKPKLEEKIENTEEKVYSLTLYNDDIHSFDYVIEALMDVCQQDSIQAEQCTYITHHKGECQVKKGSLAVLKPMKNGLLERELIVTLDK